MKPSTGAIPSPFDNRDINSENIGLATPLPNEYESSKIKEWPVWDQKGNGSCTAHALAKAMQWYWYKKHGEVVNFSPRFLYAVAKCIDGYLYEGTWPRIVASILTKYGCATEKTCPNNSDLPHEDYVYQRKLENIPKEAFAEAEKYKIGGYAFVPVDETAIKKALLDTGYVCGLLNIDKNWWTPSFLKKHVYPLRPPTGLPTGHEIGIIGYHESDFQVIINSWTDSWADKGFNKFSWATYKPHIVELLILKDLDPEIIDEAKKVKYIFTQDLRYGDKSVAVKQLQIRLGHPEKYQTGYYGNITKASVLAFQEKHLKLSWYERYVLKGSVCGPKTREALNVDNSL